MTDYAGNTIVLTGAGASKPVGYATTAEFFDEELSGLAWSPNQANVFTALVNVLGDGSKDVENILRILQPAEDFLKTASGDLLRQLSAIHSQQDHYSRPIASLAKQVRERCFDVYGAEPDDNKVEEIFSPLLQLLNWGQTEVSIFTLNYDLVLDSILDLARKNDVKVYDGFTVGRNRYRQNGYADPLIKLRLYRLHGSLSWIKTGGEIVNQRHCAKTSRPHIYIPPGFKGEPNLEEHGEPIYQAHQHLLSALATASRCIVIGYSFRDPHINVEVQRALHNNKNLTILVVDPNVPDAAESAFTELSKKNKGRFVHIQQKFGSETAISELRKYF